MCCLGLAACGRDTENTQEVPGITGDGGEYVYMPTFWELDPLEGMEGVRYIVRGILPTEEQLYYAVRTYDEGSDVYIFYRSYREFSTINQIPTRVLQASGVPFVDTITEDGRILVGTYERGSYQLAQWDLATGEVGEPLANLPEGCQQVWPASENKVLVSDGKMLLTYNVDSGESITLLNWLDSNINVGSIRSVGMTEQDGIAVVCSLSGEDPFATKYEFALLSKVERAQVPIKEVITLATIAAPSDELKKVVVAFNKTNSQYRVEIKSYIEAQGDFSKLTDARNRFMADLVSGNGPDLIYLEYLD